MEETISARKQVRDPSPPGSKTILICHINLLVFYQYLQVLVFYPAEPKLPVCMYLSPSIRHLLVLAK